HFVAAGVWDAAPLETELLIQADKLVGGSEAVLVIDDTAMPKKGKHGRRQCAICFGIGQDRQLPNAGITDTGSRRGARRGRSAPLPSRKLDERPGTSEAGWCSGR